MSHKDNNFKNYGNSTFPKSFSIAKTIMIPILRWKQLLDNVLWGYKQSLGQFGLF